MADAEDFYNGVETTPYHKDHGTIEHYTLGVLLEILAELKAKAST